MTTQESQFCETKGKHLTFLNPMTILQTMKARPRISLENIFNVINVTKECILSRSDSWIIQTEFRSIPVAKITPLRKKKPSATTVKLMVKCYKESADDDLALAKEFEGTEPQIDDDTDQ